MKKLILLLALALLCTGIQAKKCDSCKDDMKACIQAARALPPDQRGAAASACAANTKSCHEGVCNVGPTCAEGCTEQYDGCIAGAGGDNDIVALCEANKAACLAACP
jgi:hypothetical protein